MAASSAGLKSDTFTLSNGGMPPYGPAHFISRGLAAFSAASILVSFVVVINIAIIKAAKATAAKRKLNNLVILGKLLFTDV